MTYIIFESGSAPIRKQFRLDLPLFIFSKDIPYVGVNFPYLQPIDSYTPYLRAEGGGVAVNTEKIADMDDIIRNTKAEVQRLKYDQDGCLMLVEQK